MFSKQQAIAAIKMEGFNYVKKRLMHDTYYTHLPRGQRHSYRELMANSILLRRFDDANSQMVYKHKFFDANGNVFFEDKYDCDIGRWSDAVKIMSLANFNMWCEKKAELHIFEKNRREICVQDVEGLGIFLEIESGTSIQSIPDLIKLAKSLNLPLDEDFHVKLPYLLYLKNKL